MTLVHPGELAYDYLEGDPQALRLLGLARKGIESVRNCFGCGRWYVPAGIR